MPVDADGIGDLGRRKAGSLEAAPACTDCPRFAFLFSAAGEPANGASVRVRDQRVDRGSGNLF